MAKKYCFAVISGYDYESAELADGQAKRWYRFA
jgi:hypothetical protein